MASLVLEMTPSLYGVHEQRRFHAERKARRGPNCRIPHEILATEELLLANFCLL